MRCLFLFLLPSLLLASASSYTIDTPFTATGATATGALGGRITAIGGTFDGVSSIVVTLSDGTHTVNATAVVPASGASFARWSLTIPSTTGTYSLTGVSTGGSVGSNPSAQNVAVGAVLSLSTLQANYRAMQCGNFFHFNMSTFAPTSNQWANPNLPVNTFAPTSSSIPFSSWTTAVKSWGCNYATFTSKHLDGFKLWYSDSKVGANPVYGVQSTSWYAANGSPDLVLQFVNANVAAGVKSAIYFSIADRTYEIQSNTTSITGTAAYNAEVAFELTELLTYYGAVQAIWTDSWGWTPDPTTPGATAAVGHHAYITVAPILSLIHQLQPNCMLLENDHNVPGAGDMTVFEVPIQGYPTTGANVAESADTITWSQAKSNWFFDSNGLNAAMIQTPRALAGVVPLLNAVNSNYLLDLAPDLGGAIPAVQTASLSAIAAESAWTNNAALSGTASASTTFSGFPTTYLNDGNYGHAVLFWSSANELSPWAQIDLGGDRLLNHVEIINRNDAPSSGIMCCGGFMRDLTVTICTSAAGSGCVSPAYTSAVLNPLNAAYTQADYVNGPGQLSVSPNATGRYVRVSRNNSTTTGGNNSLALTEILAFPIASNPFVITGSATASGGFSIH